VTLVLRYEARSDRGLVRANNEDSVYAGARLLALADGMGGHAAGEVASQLVIAALAHLDDDEPGGDLLTKLNDAVREGNAAIAAHVEHDPDLEGMGTTLTAILFAGNKLGLVHIGDSRGYLLRDGELTQITKDDTFVQTLVDEGRITAEEAHSHPQRSLIMRALTGHEVEPTLTMREARAGDRYLLCSDGLSDPVSHDTILDALQIPDVAESADRLIEMALRGGGPDNVTVVVADVVDYDYGQTQPILAGAVSGVDDPIAPPNTSAGRASAINPKRNIVPKRVVAAADSPVKRPRSWRRIIIAIVLLILLAAAALLIGGYIIGTNYYVASTSDGTVSIMRGIQGNLLGYPLQEQYRIGCVSPQNDLKIIDVGDRQNGCRPLNVNDLRESERRKILDGLPPGKYEDASRQMNSLKPNLLPVCQSTPAPTPTPAPPVPTTSAPATTTTTTGTTTTTTTTGTTATTTAAPAPGESPGQSPAVSPSAPGPASTTTTPAVSGPPPGQPASGTSCRNAA
jgi:protein phosphatase